MNDVGCVCVCVRQYVCVGGQCVCTSAGALLLCVCVECCLVDVGYEVVCVSFVYMCGLALQLYVRDSVCVYYVLSSVNFLRCVDVYVCV